MRRTFVGTISHIQISGWGDAANADLLDLAYTYCILQLRTWTDVYTPLTYIAFIYRATHNKHRAPLQLYSRHYSHMIYTTKVTITRAPAVIRTP